jgi:hypothetical protein
MRSFLRIRCISALFRSELRRVNMPRDPSVEKFEVAAITTGLVAASAVAWWGIGKFIVPGFGAAGGAFQAAFNATVSAAWAPIVGTAVAGGTIVLVFVGSGRAISKGLDKKPFFWTTAILGLVTPFIVDFCKEFYPNTEDRFFRTIFKGIVPVVFVLAGVLWGEKSLAQRTMLGRRIAAVIVYLTIPAIILTRSLQTRATISFSTVAAVGALVAMFVVVLMVQRSLD